jgi:CHAD domain-containing protein
MAKTEAGGREVALATTLAGAAAVGGKVAWDKLSGPGDEDEQAYGLRTGEPTPEGLRRIARGQLDRAQAELKGAPKRKLAVAVHDTRKSLKRLRAAVRLGRDALGEGTYKRENQAFRDTGRRLAWVRDASVLIETLDDLEQAAGRELPSGATAGLRKRLEAERKEALQSLKEDDVVIDAVLDELEDARTRTATWTLDTDGFSALEPGLRRIYRRGRKAMNAAAEEPSTENLHEWRKRVKDLWHAEQILRPASPKKMKKLAKRTHELSDLLGDDHDLAELRNYAATHRQCFDDRVAQVALVAVIDRCRKDLQRGALSLGSKLYRRSPKRFVGSIERGFNQRARSVAN